MIFQQNGNSMRKGKFIVFEGIDGCGKSTQSRVLFERLQREGTPAVLIREPGSTPLGEQIRRILLESNTDIHPLAEVFLFNSARSHLVHTVINEELKCGKVVICDRFFYSTAAYQGGGLGLGIDRVMKISRLATGGLDADLVILLDVEPEESQRRIGDLYYRVKGRGIDFYEQVRASYRKIVKSLGRRGAILDAHKPQDAVTERIWELCKSRRLFHQKS